MSVISHVAPENLRIVDGELVIDGPLTVKQYLKKWQVGRRIPNGTAVNLVVREDLLEYVVLSLDSQNTDLRAVLGSTQS